MERGAYKNELKNALKAASVPSVYDAAQAAKDNSRGSLLEPKAPGVPFTAREITGNIEAQRIKVDNLSVAELSGPNAASLTQGLLQTEHVPADLKDAAAQVEYRNRATAMANAGALTPKQAAVIDGENLKAPGAIPVDIFDPTASGTMDQQRVIGALKRDAELAGKFRGVVSSGSGYAEPAQEAIVDAITSKQVQDMEKDFRSTADPAKARELADAMEAISRPVEAHISRRGVPAGQRIKDVDPELDSVYKSVRRAARAMASAGVTPPPANL
jgi:hypothetical protein